MQYSFIYLLPFLHELISMEFKLQNKLVEIKINILQTLKIMYRNNIINSYEKKNK